MSSTNRANAKERNQSDYYVTPVSAIQEFLGEFRKDFPDFAPKLICDPCAGGDEHHPMSYPVALEKHSGWSGYKIGTCDIRQDSLAEKKADFFTLSFPFKFDLVISNPPFCLAREFVDKSLEVTRDGGMVVMLLRLNFFGSQSRFQWWKQNMPVATYVHNKRMAFTDDGGTDSIEYMHACWIKGQTPSHTRLKII